ncbi:hypothetical protein PGSY75_0728800 [Plasmodium gaboni]|uniref:Uncharacterized protein n=1 Tax=Plasmodium gaboni TaxID=647221 RepID=A0A151LQF7_9APIC|nr:hypothetical protein PGSY75_0728800 [Plasmodium gaboni]KYO01421.1 hypothetical protein PGSY75_0728800 [Plasmodium gaboni]
MICLIFYVLFVLLLQDIILWKNINVKCYLKRNESSYIKSNLNLIDNYVIRKNFFFLNNKSCWRYKDKGNEYETKLKYTHMDIKNRNRKYKLNMNTKNIVKEVVKDIQGVWKFFLPVYIMDREFKRSKDINPDENYNDINKNTYDNNDEEDNDNDDNNNNNSNTNDEMNDDVNNNNNIYDLEDNENTDMDINNKNNSDDENNLNLLRGERLQPLPMFVYNYENIVSASDWTYAYWSNEYLEKNIFECTIKIINKMNSKYMILLQGYLFLSDVNALSDRNIRLVPAQIFTNIFLAHNDNVDESSSLIPPNVKVYDKNGNEVKDVLSILEKKVPEFKNEKKKIESFLGIKKWKYLGISTAYKIVGEGKNMFNINHMLTGKDENIFYNIMDFDTINNNYNKQGFTYLKEVFNSYFHKPSNETFSLIMKNLQEKSINGPF